MKFNGLTKIACAIALAGSLSVAPKRAKACYDCSDPTAALVVVALLGVVLLSAASGGVGSFGSQGATTDSPAGKLLPKF